MFLAEKGLQIEQVTVDLRSGENREASYLAINPAGHTPALQLDDGSSITEITAICEYVEEVHPQPVLIGETARSRAETRMWVRRVDLKICEPIGNGYRFGEGLAFFESRTRCLPEAAEGLKAIARDGLEWLETQMHGPWIAGERLTLADILLFGFVDFGAGAGQPLDPALVRLTDWYGRMKARPSADA